MFKLVLKSKASEFTGRLSLVLSTPLVLKGHWEVAVTHLEINRSGACLVLCDLVDFTFVGDERMRLLEYYREPPHQLTYVSVVKNLVESINVDVVSSTGDNKNHDADILCVLHFRKS